MTINSLRRYLAVALPFVGSAILLYSCKAEHKVTEEQVNTETLMTEYSEDLSIQMSENGLKSYSFSTPLMEGYAMARDPYKEFRKGVKVIMYEDDSTSRVSATLTSNYAIFYDNRKLWEAKGDVVVIQTNGRKLYTQQLFWNQATHRIYSNVDSRIIDGDEIYDCEGFESDENMTDWRYRKLKGVTYFTDTESNSNQSLAEDSTDGKASNDGAKSDSKKESKSIPNNSKKANDSDSSQSPSGLKRKEQQRIDGKKLNGEPKQFKAIELDKKAMPKARANREEPSM